MLTKRMKKAISLRLGPFVKYFICGGFYWDKRQDRFVRTQTYSYWSWCATYYMGHWLQIVLIAYVVYLNMKPDEILEDGEESFPELTSGKNFLLTILALAIWFTVTGILALGSALVEYRDEMTEGANQVFIVGDLLSMRLRAQGLSIPEGASKRYIKRMENLVVFICVAPFMLVIVFSVSLFHPANPIRNIFENMFEVEVTPKSPYAWGLLFAEFFGILGFMGIAVSAILVMVLIVFVTEVWLEAAMPSGKVKLHLGKRYFQTEHLGYVPESMLLMIYRILQLTSLLGNTWIGTPRVAYHTMAALGVAVVTAYALINHSGLIVQDGSVMAYGLGGLIACALFISVLVVYVECVFVDGMDTKWRLFKKRIFDMTLRTTTAYKTAKSFQKVSLDTGYPFCNVNRSTFMDWCNIWVDRLMDLLMGTE